MDYSKFKNLQIGHYLTILLHHSSHLNHKKLEQELRKVGLSVERFIILHIICALGGVTNPSSITRETILEPHAISALLIRMEKDGLITRTAYEKPKNTVRVELTEEAKKMMERAWQIMPELDEFWEDCLTNDEVKVLLKLLEKIKRYNLPAIYGNKKNSDIPIPEYDP
ncbi:MarR family transcriptional regulator, partial [Dehalococcoides mccartyi]